VSEIDARYSPFLKSGWTPDRLALVDRLVLRLAVFELWGMPEIPPKVTITEAVELAKRFGGADSGSFINGVLGRVLQVSPKAGWTGEAAEVADVSEPEDVGEQSGTSAEPEHSWTLSSDE
jgi:N utilization substance protein B